MKGISVKQPWANFIRDEDKPIETRMWRTHYRGPLLICASKTIDKAALEHHKHYCQSGGMLLGHAIAVANLIDIRYMKPADEPLTMCPWEPSRFAWILKDVKPIAPFSVKGMLGLFEVELPESHRYLEVHNGVPQ